MQNVTFANCMSVLRNTGELNTAFLHQVLHDDHDDLIFSTQEKLTMEICVEIGPVTEFVFVIVQGLCLG